MSDHGDGPSENEAADAGAREPTGFGPPVPVPRRIEDALTWFGEQNLHDLQLWGEELRGGSAATRPVHEPVLPLLGPGRRNPLLFGAVVLTVGALGLLAVLVGMGALRGVMVTRSISPPGPGVSFTPVAAPGLEQREPAPPIGVAPPAQPPEPPPLGRPAAESPAADWVRQVVGAEAGLETGVILARIDYGNGNRAEAVVTFDLDRNKLFSTTTYTGPNGSDTRERLTLKGQSWERRTEAWAPVPDEGSVRGRVQAFLPAAVLATDPVILDGEPPVTLRWHNPTGPGEATLWVDPATGVPLELRRVLPDGVTWEITYQGWNVPVDIPGPPVR